jgi:hypothetical protein
MELPRPHDEVERFIHLSRTVRTLVKFDRDSIRRLRRQRERLLSLCENLLERYEDAAGPILYSFRDVDDPPRKAMWFAEVFHQLGIEVRKIRKDMKPDRTRDREIDLPIGHLPPRLGQEPPFEESLGRKSNHPSVDESVDGDTRERGDIKRGDRG